MTSLARPKPKIRPPRKGLAHDSNDVDFEEAWTIISSSLQEMHTKNASNLSFEKIFRHAYKIVLKKKGEVFYERLQKFETDWLSKDVRVRLATLLTPSLKNDGTVINGVATTANERRTNGEKFLRGLKESFEDHQLVMNMATDVFMYLVCIIPHQLLKPTDLNKEQDRVYCVDMKKPTVYTSAMILYRDHILRQPLVADASETLSMLNRIILEQIAMERDGDVIDTALIKSCINMLESLFESSHESEDEKLYLTSFEEGFLKASRQFYAEEGTRLLREADAAAYCRHTRKRIHEEISRCKTTLSDSTTPKITSVLEDELIKKRIQELIAMDSGVRYMIDNNRFGDLELVFELNSRIDDRKSELTQAIQRRVQEVGRQINDAAANLSTAQNQSAQADQNQEEGRPKVAVERAATQQTQAALQWVDAILQLKDKYDHLWQVSFRSDPIIQPALTKSFTESINVFPRSSEYVSLFIDENMKKGLKDKTEAEVDQVLEKAIVLLRYIQDKDMFERYYKKHLCKRLLMGKSVSVDVEKQMIQRMKIELGNSFTAKLEAMFKDMALSEELTASYRKKISQMSESKRTDLSLHVLTSMTWPLETMQSSSSSADGGEAKSKVIYPVSIERMKHSFENFYAERHSGRMLTWLPHMGTADIRAVFPKVSEKEGPLGKERRHELNVSTYAMFVLMLFNDVPEGGSLSFDEIHAKTNIDTNDLIRNLQSLAVAPKTRVLMKEPMSKDVKPTDRFFFNEKFTSGFLKIKVGVVAGANRVEGEKERRETEKKNNDSRAFAIEAAVVRIMKQRKELSHQQLTAETLAVLSSQFKPDVTMIKKRIESLIEREYLERVEGGTTASYRYLA
ncbi:MAG: Cullin-3 [Chrysothrix sp. TS-e1954]|nr:MAG: Cullin-3 [Chrysothrix sp. TS-e1954]